MNHRVAFFLCILLIVGWVFYFKLKPNNFSLLLNFKQPTPVSPVYYLKTTREQIQSLFIMGNRDSSEWNFTLSQKRALESQILCDHKLSDLGNKQLSLAQKYYKTGTSYLNNLIDKIDTNYLSQEKGKTENLIKNTCK